MKLSIIVPVYNEEGIINEFHKVLSEVLDDISYEVIYINDGSIDKSKRMLDEIYLNDKKHVKVLSFSRNFGKDAAIYAGIVEASGEYTCLIDSDLQQHPKYIFRMLDFLEHNKDYDEMCMIQAGTKKRGFAKLFYRLISKMSNMKFIEGASDFRMFNRSVKSAVLSLSEKIRFSKGIFSYIGFNIYYEPYKVSKRTTGTSKFNFKNKFKYAFEGIVGYSTMPLRLATYTGIITSLSAFIYLVVTIVKTLVYGINTPGYASIICIVLFLGGVELLCTGILGEYLAKTYIEVKNRPVYILKEKKGFDDNVL
ncbi:MAG: glycosyltransferase family 2 protein [Bacilli bacterium]